MSKFSGECENKKDDPDKTITCCPRCYQDQFEVTVHGSGTTFDGEVTGGYFYGHGVCGNCGLDTDYCDSWP